MSEKTPKRYIIGAQYIKVEKRSTITNVDIAIAAARARQAESAKAITLEEMDRLSCEFQDVDSAFHKSYSSDGLDLKSLYNLLHDQDTLLHRLQKLQKESSKWIAIESPYEDLGRIQFIASQSSAMIVEQETRVDFLEGKYHSSKILNMKTTAELEKEAAFWKRVPQIRVSDRLKKKAPGMLNLCESALLKIPER